MKQLLLIFLLFLSTSVFSQRIVIQKIATKQYVQCMKPLLLTYKYSESLEFEKEELKTVLNILNRKNLAFKIVK